MIYGFFPGCTLEFAAEELMISTKKVASALGIELIELGGGRAAVPVIFKMSMISWGWR